MSWREPLTVSLLSFALSRLVATMFWDSKKQEPLWAGAVSGLMAIVCYITFAWAVIAIIWSV